jgi:GNAT superfamily N-acetyltransferase
VAVRLLTPGDEAILRALRLKALRDSPDQFDTTYEREAARTTEDWQRWFSPGATFVVDGPGPDPVGLAAGVLDAEDRSVVWLMAMWVEPAARGSGAGDALVDAVVGWARVRDTTSVRLGVVEGNAPARRLYERHGFVPTGRTDRDGWVEIAMELAL